MAPPCYADLGKSAKDIFSKNYHLGLVKLDVKTKTANNVEFSVNGTSIPETQRVNASFETKYFFREIGCTLKEKWTTDNNILSELAFEDQICKGSKVTLIANIAPQSGKKSGSLKTLFKGDCYHANTDFDFDSLNNGTLINSSIVLGHQGWLAGANVSFNPQQGKLNKTNFALGYQDGALSIHANVSDGKEFAGSVYQKLNKNLESAIILSAQPGTTTPLFSLGGLYRMDNDTVVKARVNTKSVVGLTFIRKLHPGISVTLTSSIDCKNFNQGGHKLGLGIELEK